MTFHTRQIFTKCCAFHAKWDSHDVPRLPRYLQVVNTSRNSDKMTMEFSKVLRLPRKMQLIFWKRRDSIAPVTQNDFRHVMKHVTMSHSATPATWNEATRRLKPPKVTTFAELATGTAIATSLRTVVDGCRRLPTVADGCRQLRSQKRHRANTSPPPDPQSKTRTFRYAFGKNWGTFFFQLSFRGVASCGGFGHLMFLHGSTGIIQGSLGRPLLSSYSRPGSFWVATTESFQSANIL